MRPDRDALQDFFCKSCPYLFKVLMCKDVIPLFNHTYHTTIATIISTLNHSFIVTSAVITKRVIATLEVDAADPLQPVMANAPLTVAPEPVAAEKQRRKAGEDTTGATTKTMPRRPRDPSPRAKKM